jgi:serine-type D-Ala-D-Ala carboxypeptidase (penicillin-binding protein 5/6)
MLDRPVAPSVLTGGVRRRRFPVRLFLVAAVACGAAAGGAWFAVGSGGGGNGPGAPEAAQAATRTPLVSYRGSKVAPARLPSYLLAVTKPVARGGFAPGLTAESAIVVDQKTGTVLWAKHEHRRLPIASTTKILTAALAFERLAPHDIVTIDPSVPRAAPFREGLRAHEKVQAWKLFYGLLLYSGNDDALALAIASAGSRGAFLHLMNERVRQLGLRDSHFTSPSGVVDKGNYSSAWDLAAIARYAMRNPRFRAVVRTRIKHVKWAAPTYSKIYVNKNYLLGTYPGATGIKTGWTTLASHCLVASASRGGVHLLAVVIHASDPYGDMRRLLNYGFATRG